MKQVLCVCVIVDNTLSLQVSTSTRYVCSLRLCCWIQAFNQTSSLWVPDTLCLPYLNSHLLFTLRYFWSMKLGLQHKSINRKADNRWSSRYSLYIWLDHLVILLYISLYIIL